MGDSENNLQPSKKRAAGVQLSRDNPGLGDDDETSDQETGTFKRASEDVLATRRIVKVRRQQTSSTPAAPVSSTASNPFAAIRLVPPPSAPPEVEAHSVQSKETKQIDESKSESKSDEPPKGESSADEKTDVNDDNCKKSENKAGDSEPQQKDENDDISNQEVDKSVKEEAGGGNFGDEVKSTADCDTTETLANKDVKDEREKNEKVNEEATAEKNAETAPFSSFHQLSSSQNAFSGLSGTGFSSTSFSFGSISKDGSTFSCGNSNNGSSSIFGTSSANSATKSEGSKFPPMQEVPLETGEENEKAVFTSDSVIFEFIDGGWKERGKGELKVNVSTTGTGKARLVMRARGNYRLILNASLFPDMKLTNMDKKGVTFACVNSVACVNSAGEGKKDGLSTFALKFKDSSIVEDFRAAVMEHKSVGPVAVKSPENSPKADE